MKRHSIDSQHFVRRRNPVRHVGAGFSVLAAAMLAACSTAPMQQSAAPSGGTQSPRIESSPPPVVAATSPKRPFVSKRGGAFYKDDGPGESPPDNLAEVPDAVPQAEPLHRFANRPYSVFGQAYVPATALAPYREQGMASWYGRKFHGLNTSSGEAYDMYGMTAAHPTLPIPSYARVTNLANGRSVVVRINDRGPFHKGRIIDLSYTAAYKLGYVDLGSTQVEVMSILGDEVPLIVAKRPVPPVRNREKPMVAKAPYPVPVPAAALASAANPQAESAVSAGSIAATASVLPAEGPLTVALASPPPAAPADTSIAPAVASSAAKPAAPVVKGAFLQLGAFTTLANAEGFRNHVKEELAWLGSRLVLAVENGRYRLHAGPYASAEEAQSIASRIADSLKLRPFLVWR
ncbi:MAG: septal ring lytic transglycosylase RlpA family protein [Zoogloeaceae bacterium]|nr:septal ring lytic transglycosylase RlpA family protein [Zoogloeaceae bacterium]